MNCEKLRAAAVESSEHRTNGQFDLALVLEKVVLAAVWADEAVERNSAGCDGWELDEENEAFASLLAAARELESVALPYDPRAEGCLLYDGPETPAHLRHCSKCSGKGVRVDAPRCDHAP